MTHAENEQRLLAFCTVPRSREEMMEHTDMINEASFRTHYIRPMLAEGKLIRLGGGKNTKYISAAAQQDK